MISRLKGKIIEKHPPLLLLEISGIAYELSMPISCFYKLPSIQKEAIIFTHFAIYKDTPLLFGFNNKQEQILFRNLIKINGIGPKLALSILSGMSTKQFINAIIQENITELTKLNGISKKIAERLTIEMKDRLKELDNEVFVSIDDFKSTSKTSLAIKNIEQEAVAALVALGYKPKEASFMISKVYRSDANIETLIREALHSMY